MARHLATPAIRATQPSVRALRAPSVPDDLEILETRETGLGHLPGAILLAALAIVIVLAQHRLWWHYPIGVDLEIPLRAAERWLAGGNPYLASAFQLQGMDLPFLYPPFVLPLVAPFTLLPRVAVVIPWLALLVGVAYVSARRLGFGPVVAGLVLLWPPYTEALMGGNIQILLFAGYAALMYRRGRHGDPNDRERAAVVDGALGAFVGAIKVSQIHAWLYVLRRRPAAAALGLVLVAIVLLVTLPLLGTELWFEWVTQLGRAASPALGAMGFPLADLVGQPTGLLVAGLSAIAVFVVPPRRAGAWVGILTVVGTASPHIFTMLFLLPAMRQVPRSVGVLAGILIASYVPVLMWTAVALVTVGLVLIERDLRLDQRLVRSMPIDDVA
jgi:glycosyl transferase family 87